ncbi:MAG: hypothetical protein CMJ65_05390 [Planctomycetaceae bacterium]|jgi:hypothetical protein|nr:hypothetical protein [Planctomycetaceae bacterium]MDP7278196.1 hypothetical protein [Planctomycetaceae bacterium]
MRHFTCDLCGDSIHDDRYVVKMEIFAAFDPDELKESDFDSDTLAAVSEQIAAIESGIVEAPSDSSAQRFRFDLCEGCRTRFADDPLARDAMGRVNFSEN